MANSHDHHHDASAYYTEQLCTIAICGAMGGIAVALYATGGLNVLLKEGILTYSVLAGGIALLALVFIRAVALWFQVGEPVAHHHEHSHNDCGHDDCGHEHGVTTAAEGQPLVTGEHHHHEHEHHHDHNHSHDGHSHDHSWAPIRYIVLLVPVALYFFVPLDALTTAHGFQGPIDPEWAKAVQATGDLGQLAFKELDGAASDPMRRNYYAGKIATITGQFVPSPNERMFSLVRMKIRCCAADAVPLPFPILVNDALARDLTPEQRVPDGQALSRKWVEVTCQIQFRQRPDQPNEWVTLLVVQPTKDKPITQLLKPTKPDPNPYL
jgi:hypothetical protein